MHLSPSPTYPLTPPPIPNLPPHPDPPLGSVVEESWEDWQAPPPEMKCLVCEVVYTRFGEVKHHMMSQHNVNLDALTQNMSYYKQVSTYYQSHTCTTIRDSTTFSVAQPSYWENQNT